MPGTRAEPHCGETNLRLTCHLCNDLDIILDHLAWIPELCTTLYAPCDALYWATMLTGCVSVLLRSDVLANSRRRLQAAQSAAVPLRRGAGHLRGGYTGFDIILDHVPRIPQPMRHPARAVRRTLLGGHADGMLNGACNPMLHPQFASTGETRRWTEGAWLCFDDSFEHSVWNLTPEPRTVVVVNIRHPSLWATPMAKTAAKTADPGNGGKPKPNKKKKKKKKKKTSAATNEPRTQRSEL